MIFVWRARGSLIAAVITAISDGCARQAVNGGGEAPAAAVADTVRGVVTIVGNDPRTVVTLRLPQTPEPVAITGSAAEDLRAANGLEVMIEGRRTGERSYVASPLGAPVFESTRFAIRAQDGAPAMDGVLERDGERFVLRREDGSRAVIGRLPQGLRDHVGARVFLVGGLDAPTNYGVLHAAHPAPR